MADHVMTGPSAAAPVPLFFGPGESLFGMYHPPDAVPRRAGAVVLCYPGGHEYLRVQRTYRNAAVALARLGFAVLRFDYSGSGDSAGDGADVDLASWSADLESAIVEVQRRSGASRVGLAGVRLGGSIAWLVASARHDVEAVVAWDSVVDGDAYISDLRALEDRWLADPSRARTARHTSGTLLGFPLGARLEQSLRALRLDAAAPQTRQTFVIDSIDRPDRHSWRGRVQHRYGPRSYAVVPAFLDWDTAEAVHTAVYPAQFSQALTTVFGAVMR
jgi:alpha/beta superfamily hydrolase